MSIESMELLRVVCDRCKIHRPGERPSTLEYIKREDLGKIEAI